MTKSHFRLHTSNDNPFSELHFKILKYGPEFPDRFYSLVGARAFCTEFYGWYNGDSLRESECTPHSTFTTVAHPPFSTPVAAF